MSDAALNSDDAPADVCDECDGEVDANGLTECGACNNFVCSACVCRGPFDEELCGECHAAALDEHNEEDETEIEGEETAT